MQHAAKREARPLETCAGRQWTGGGDPGPCLPLPAARHSGSLPSATSHSSRDPHLGHFPGVPRLSPVSPLCTQPLRPGRPLQLRAQHPRPPPHALLLHGSLILLCSLRLGWRQALGCDSGGPGGPFPGPLSRPRGGVGWAAPARALLLVPGVPGTDSKGVGTEKNRELGQGRSEYSPVQRRAGPPVTRSPVLVAGPTDTPPPPERLRVSFPNMPNTFSKRKIGRIYFQSLS